MLRSLVGALVVACLSVAIVIVHQGRASSQVPAFPDGSTPELYVVGYGATDGSTVGGSAVLPFDTTAGSEHLETLTATSDTNDTAVADTPDDLLTVVLPQVRPNHNNTHCNCGWDAATDTAVGSISLPPAGTNPAQLVAVAADPVNSNFVFIISTTALYVANLTDLPLINTVQVYAVPTDARTSAASANVGPLNPPPGPSGRASWSDSSYARSEVRCPERACGSRGVQRGREPAPTYSSPLFGVGGDLGRAQMVLLSVQGMDVAGIARVAFTSPDRVREVINNFNEDGFSRFTRGTRAAGRPPSPSPSAKR